MKIRIVDNKDTNCRELWVNDTIQLALNISEIENPESYGYSDDISNLIAFAPWTPGATHMDTERSDVVQTSNSN